MPTMRPAKLFRGDELPSRTTVASELLPASSGR
jgi:hypothetical protein